MVYRKWHKRIFNGVTIYLTNSPSNVRYSSLMYLAKLAGIPYGTVRSRLRSGKSLREALTPGYAAGHKIPVGDAVYNAKELSATLGLHKATIGKRIARGWDVADLAKPSKRKRIITAFNETKTFSQWCKEKGLCRGTLAHRLDVLHMTPEQALTLPINETYRKNAKRQKRIMKSNLNKGDVSG